MNCVTSTGVAVEVSANRGACRPRLTPAEIKEARRLVARALVRGVGYSQGQAGQVLGVGRSKLARLLDESPTKPRRARRRPSLSPAEAEAMLRDHDRDPFATADDRETVRAWVASHVPRGPKPGVPVPIRSSEV